MGSVSTNSRLLIRSWIEKEVPANAQWHAKELTWHLLKIWVLPLWVGLIGEQQAKHSPVPKFQANPWRHVEESTTHGTCQSISGLLLATCQGLPQRKPGGTAHCLRTSQPANCSNHLLSVSLHWGPGSGCLSYPTQPP